VVPIVPGSLARPSRSHVVLTLARLMKLRSAIQTTP
jgi:hypothetical protein